MKFNIIKYIAAVIISIFGLTMIMPPLTLADGPCDASVPDQVREAAGCNENDAKDKLPSTIQNILNVIIGISSFIAVVFIIIGGIQYMTSAGDGGKVKKARETILYAVIGLIVCALSFAIVNFAIGNIDASQSTEAGKSIYA